MDHIEPVNTLITLMLEIWKDITLSGFLRLFPYIYRKPIAKSHFTLFFLCKKKNTDVIWGHVKEWSDLRVSDLAKGRKRKRESDRELVS